MALWNQEVMNRWLCSVKLSGICPEHVLIKISVFCTGVLCESQEEVRFFFFLKGMQDYSFVHVSRLTYSCSCSYSLLCLTITNHRILTVFGGTYVIFWGGLFHGFIDRTWDDRWRGWHAENGHTYNFWYLLILFRLGLNFKIPSGLIAVDSDHLCASWWKLTPNSWVEVSWGILGEGLTSQGVAPRSDSHSGSDPDTVGPHSW